MVSPVRKKTQQKMRRLKNKIFTGNYYAVWFIVLLHECINMFLIYVHYVFLGAISGETQSITVISCLQKEKLIIHTLQNDSLA